MTEFPGERAADSTPPESAPAQPTVPPRPPAPPAAGPSAAGAPAGWRAAGAPGQSAPNQPAYPPGYGPPAYPRPQGSAYGPPPQHPHTASQPTIPQPQPQPQQTQPTVPLPPATGAAAVAGAPKREKNEKSGAGRVAGLLVAAAIVGGAAGLGGAYAGVALFAPTSSSPVAGPGAVTINNADEVNQTTAIAAKVLPSVVTIAASTESGGGTGSGVVLTRDGYVVTNTHVVTLDGATGEATVRVTTSDGRVYDAEVVGTDPLYDLAVIKLVDAEDLTPIEFADSNALNVGDQTVAVGAPLGLSNTVTTGIVSALHRSIQIASSAAPDTGEGEGEVPDDGGEQFFFDFGPNTQAPGQGAEPISIAVIQTDAAINPGNSGGALVDSEGKLIGINVAIASAGSSSGQAGSIGVGFAIPSNVVERISGELIDDGAATHGLLGATVQGAASVEGSKITGAWIKDVTPGGAADAAGLRAGDTITVFDDIPITDATDLTAQVRAKAAGSTATVTYVRDGRTQTADVTLGELTP